ncbi:D12 class N6 adenine-specific DNA methyltransferase domain protein, partial [Candidatus Magnetobacterium bavaricum]
MDKLCIVRQQENGMKPFLKWAGGKTRLLPELLKYVPGKYERYIDPFVGGGALFFHLQPNRAIIADANEHLIET